MNERRFVNRSQPQTLYIGRDPLLHRLCVFNLLGGFAGWSLVGFALAAGGVRHREREEVGLLARESARPIAAGVAAVRVLRARPRSPQLRPLLDLIFYGALVGLLLHPMSRDYQRIWFR